MYLPVNEKPSVGTEASTQTLGFRGW